MPPRLRALFVRRADIGSQLPLLPLALLGAPLLGLTFGDALPFGGLPGLDLARPRLACGNVLASLLQLSGAVCQYLLILRHHVSQRGALGGVCILLVLRALLRFKLGHTAAISFLLGTLCLTPPLFCPSALLGDAFHFFFFGDKAIAAQVQRCQRLCRARGFAGCG